MNRESRAWLILIVAGFMETVWAVAMDYSEGFTRIPFDIVVIVFLIISMTSILLHSLDSVFIQFLNSLLRL